MVCKSGVVYCNTVKIRDDGDNESDDQSNSLLLLQDVKIRVGNKSVQARTFFDNGSNQVLLRNKFGKDHGLRSQDIRYRLETVGGTSKTVGGTSKIIEGKLLEVELEIVTGDREKIRGFGI